MTYEIEYSVSVYPTFGLIRHTSYETRTAHVKAGDITEALRKLRQSVDEESTETTRVKLVDVSRVVRSFSLLIT